MHFSLDRITGADIICFDMDLNLTGTTKTLISMTDKINLNKISAENLPEWQYRLNILNRLQGNNNQRINVEQLTKHVGLLTSAVNKDRFVWLSGIEHIENEEKNNNNIVMNIDKIMKKD